MFSLKKAEPSQLGTKFDKTVHGTHRTQHLPEFPLHRIITIIFPVYISRNDFLKF